MGARSGRAVLVSAALLFGLSLVLSASPAGAVELQGGCKGTGTPHDRNGRPMAGTDSAGPGQTRLGQTRANPLPVDSRGTIQFSGTAAAAMRDPHWRVEAFGVPIKTGGSANPGALSAQATVRVRDFTRVRLTGLYYLTGRVSGTGGNCSGHLWLKLVGSPVATPAWFVGLGLVGAGILVLATARPESR